MRGTRYGIRVDETDGLLAAGEPGVQLTWMDAQVGDWVVTPRIGKPVEINALWYNALVAHGRPSPARSGVPADRWDALAARAGAGFARFWNAQAGYCYDVIDGPAGRRRRAAPQPDLRRVAAREPALAPSASATSSTRARAGS